MNSKYKDNSSLIIACGAIAKELQAIKQLNQWESIKVQCLPADLHNRPEKIPEAVESKILRYRGSHKNIFVAYADCGTGGLLDKVIHKYGLTRLPGAHCYEFFSGSYDFSKLSEACLGTFYLTDFLTRHFDRLVKKGLGLDSHPELIDDYFKNYEKLVYLSQTHSIKLQQMSQAHAQYLGLNYTFIHTGLDSFNKELKEKVIHWKIDDRIQTKKRM